MKVNLLILAALSIWCPLDKELTKPKKCDAGFALCLCDSMEIDDCEWSWVCLWWS
jgi:hypothetical protein